MVNGLYSVAFFGPGGASGTGTAQVRDGTIHGGDAAFGYLGTFALNGSKVTASLRVLRHQDGHISVFGPMKDFKLELAGATEGDRFQFSGGIPQQPGMTLTVRGLKFAELIDK